MPSAASTYAGVAGGGAEGEGEADQVEPRAAAGGERDQRAGEREAEGDGGAEAKAVAPQGDGAERDEGGVGGQKQAGQGRVDALHGAEEQRRLEPEQPGAQQHGAHHVARGRRRVPRGQWPQCDRREAEPHGQQRQQRDALVRSEGGER